MGFVIQYYSHGTMVWETNWSSDIPPSCHHVRSSLAVHDAEKAIILDDNGFELVVEERQKYDA